MSCRHLRRRRPAVMLSVAALCLVQWTASALAQSSPTTITPDRATTLVSKDINGQRWAIARDHATGAVSGNVFIPGSDDPQFVWCQQTGETADGYNYDCHGTGRCAVADCAASWTGLTTVVLPRAFFAAGTEPQPTPTPAPTPIRTPTPAPASCPQNGPLTDLRTNCSAYVYFYRTGPVIAGLTSNGSLAVVCMTSPTTGILCARGPVRGQVDADLTQASVDSSPYVAIGAGSNLRLAGSRIDVRLVVQGERFDFGFTWFDTDRASSTGIESFFPEKGAMGGALGLDGRPSLEAAARRLVAEMQ